MVPSAVFAGALSRLESVYLGLYTRVTAGQLEALFTVLTSHQAEAGEPKLRQLGLNVYGNLSPVSSELLVRAIQRLENVEFFYARMTVEQITAVHTMVKENRQGRLKTVKIHQDGIVSVSPVLIREARMNHAVNIITLEF